MAILLALVSSAMWGTADFLGGLHSRKRVALAVVGGSQLAGLIAVSAFAFAVGAQRDPLGWVPWALGAGVVGASGLVAFYAALSSGTMGVVSPVAALGVTVPVVVGLAQGDSPSDLQYAGIAVALLGAVATSGPELSGEGSKRSVVLAAFAGTCFGSVFVAIDRGAESSAEMTMVGMRLASVVIFAALALATRSLGGLTASDVRPLTVIGIFDVGANLTFAFASQLGFVSVVSVLGSLYPVATVILARVVLHERLRHVQIAGVVATMAGVGLISAG